MPKVTTSFAAFTLLALSALAAAPAHAETARLPWPAGQRVFVTQDCNDSCCNDHVGYNTYAWDFATHGAFEVLAPRSGTVVHVKMSSNRGAADASAVDLANYLVLDHGDGTYSVMLHLAFGSLDPGVRCGDFVRAGQRLALTGSTGWSSGNHLHYQVNRIPPGMNEVCECGPDGMGCRDGEQHWELFWSHQAHSGTVPAQFEEWPGASQCGDRHDDHVLTSRNVDSHDEVVVIDEGEPGRFQPLRGTWATALGGARGAFRQAASGVEAAALVSFEGRVPVPGVYEVWHALPVRGRNVGAREVRVEVIGRGERGAALASQSQPGGGYHPMPGRVKLTGRRGEGLLLSAPGRPGEALAVDGVVLRRVASTGAVGEGGACTTSAGCASDLVCVGGQCREGCDVGGCGPGATCEPTGLCVEGPEARPAAPAQVARTPAAPTPAHWSSGAETAVRSAALTRGGGPQDGRTPRVVPATAAGPLGGALTRDVVFAVLGAMAVGGMGLLRRRRR